MTLPSQKADVRKAALERRASLSPQARQAFAAVLACQGLDLLDAPCRARVASVFFPFGDEPDTLPLMAAMTSRGVVTALPTPGRRATPLRFLAWKPGDASTVGRFGIVEPLPTAPVVEPDLLFVPLAAFDRAGFRLGYGAGYYDATLALLRATKPVTAVGVAFSVQEVDSVPTEPHDQRLDAVVTEHGLRRFGTDPCAFFSSAT